MISLIVCLCCAHVRGKRKKEKERRPEREPTTVRATWTWTYSPFRLPFSTHLLLLINTTGEEEGRRETDRRNFLFPFSLVITAQIQLCLSDKTIFLPHITAALSAPASPQSSRRNASAVFQLLHLPGHWLFWGRLSRKDTAVWWWKKSKQEFHQLATQLRA